jgi:hypothetical protein
MVVEPVDGASDFLPVEDSDYNSIIESLVIPQLGPEVSWQTLPSAVAGSVPAYTYEVDLSVEVPGEPGVGTAVVGDMLVDNVGNLFEIVEWAGDTADPRHAKVRDLSETGLSPNIAGPGYVYRPRDGAPTLVQAQFVWMNAVARDKVNNYEKSILWAHRGVQVDGVQITQLESGNGVDPAGDELQAGWFGGHVATLNRGTDIYTAGETLSGHKLVIQAADGKAYLASNLNVGHRGRVVGMTTHAADADAVVHVHRFGLFTEPSWSFTPDAVLFVGDAGALVESSPSTGFSQIVGKVQSATSVLFKLEDPIFLG